MPRVVWPQQALLKALMSINVTTEGSVRGFTEVHFIIDSAIYLVPSKPNPIDSHKKLPMWL